jgi:ABC-type transporter Mla subunit MlaD
MADLPPYSGAGNDTSMGSDRESATGTPRWVKVFAIITIVVVLLFVVMLVAGGGRHGPSRHRVSDGGQLQVADVAEVGALPEGGR